MTVPVQLWIALPIGLAAVVEDLWRRQISNWTALAALLAGLVWNTYAGGWAGLGLSLLGTICGFAVFLVFYLLGGMGGGDVKLMAGFGSLLGAWRLLEAALWTAGIGGILAAAVIGVRAIRRRPRGEAVAAGKTKGESIPYAPAIALGVWLTLLGKAV